MSEDEIKRKQMAAAEQAVVLSTFAEQVAYPGCRLLEIGTWCGDSAVVLGAVAKRYGGHLYCIDWWKGNVGTDLERIAGEQDVFSVFWQRVREEGLEDTIIPIRGRSDDVAAILADGKFDLIYIDGDHRFEGIVKDIDNFAPLVRDGGILCGDDCEGRLSDFDPEFLEEGSTRDFTESVHCGVVLAVGNSFKNCSIDYNIWSVRKTGAEWEPTDLIFPGIMKKRQFPPPLIGSFQNYNILRYGRSVYAVPHGLAVDITDEAARRHPEILTAYSVADLHRKIQLATMPGAENQGGLKSSVKRETYITVDGEILKKGFLVPRIFLVVKSRVKRLTFRLFGAFGVKK